MDELLPVSCQGSEWFGLGLTLVDALDTLILANLTKEAEEATEWVHTSLRVDNDAHGHVNLFETTIRVVGGLLAAAQLRGGDLRLLQPAIELALRLSVAFDTDSGLPQSDVDLRDLAAFKPSWTDALSLSETTTLAMEFGYVARVTNLSALSNMAIKAVKTVSSAKGTREGLLPVFFKVSSGHVHFTSDTITLGARGDSYYEYLLKQYILSGRNDGFREMYVRAMQGVRQLLLAHSGPSPQEGRLLYVGEVKNKGGQTARVKMDHLVCFLPGLLALGHLHGIDTRRRGDQMTDLQLAEALMHTCYATYKHTPTGLAPEIVHFTLDSENVFPQAHQEDIGDGAFGIKPADSHNLLRPETVESLFVLWRVTRNATYQDWAWQIFRAFELHARHPSCGYTNLESVLEVPAPRRDKMESFFLAETLKYLYLIFDDQAVPLDQYVFNTEAHPLPIAGSDGDRKDAASWHLHNLPDRVSIAERPTSDGLKRAVAQLQEAFKEMSSPLVTMHVDS